MRCKKLSDIQKAIEADEYEWELSSDHEITYKERRQPTDFRPQPGDFRQQSVDSSLLSEKEAVFKAALVAAEPDALVVSVTVEEDDDPNPQRIGTDSARTRRSRPIRRTVTGLVKLSGKWELDEKNRITFSIKREFDKDNKLTFQGAWEVNGHHEVVYEFTTYTQPQRLGTASAGTRRSRPIRGVKHELIFKGTWDLSEKHCLTYSLGADTDSAFRFRGTFETQSILAKEGEIRYQVGVEYKLKTGAKKRLTQTITLFGKWKLSDDLALSFEIEYADGRRSEMRVGADITVPKTESVLDAVLPDEISVNLVTRPEQGRRSRPLGIELVLTKEFFESAQVFVRFVRTAAETRGEFGVKIPW